MKIKRLSASFSAAVVAFSSLLTITVAPLAHAAGNLYWCATITSGFNTAANWNTDVDCTSGTQRVPIDGDDLVFDVTKAGTPTADMAGLDVASITFTNSGAGVTKTIHVTAALTISGNIVTSDAGDLITLSLDGANVILGGDVDVTGQSFFNFDAQGAGGSVDMAGNALTFAVTNATSAVRVPLIGANSTLNANTTGIINALILSGANTYSGTTNILGEVSARGATPFGTSDVDIAASGSVNFSNTANTTISNQITMAGSQTISGLSFSGTPTSITYAVPNLILNGKSRFANSTVASVDLTGIQANGFCATYYGGANSGASLTDGAAHGFISAPAGCVFGGSGGRGGGSGTTPEAPDTGFALVTSNPLVTLAVAALAAGAIAYGGRRLQTATAKAPRRR